MDYKEILRNKANRLKELLYKHKESLSPEDINNIKILINNTYEITDGRLDSLDYDVRNKGIMNYHAQLDAMMSKFKSFEEREMDK